MSFGVRLGALRAARMAPGLRSATLAARPRLPPSAVLSALPARRHLSDLPPPVDHTPAPPIDPTPADTLSDLASAASAPEAAGALHAAWETAKTVLAAPSDMVTHLLLSAPTPSYLVSVFAIAVVLRSCLTVPVQIWQRRRIERLNAVVNPEIKALNDRLALEVLVTAKRDAWPYERYVAEIKKRMKDGVYALHKAHRTHPVVTMLAPVAVNVPLLIAASWGVRNALVQHPEIAQASGLWLASFGEPDSSGLLEIATAMLAAGNIELMKRATAVRKALYGGVLDADGAAEAAPAAPPLAPTSGPGSSGAAASSSGAAASSASSSAAAPPSPAPGSRVFAHRPMSPPAAPSDKRALSGTPARGKKPRARAPRAVSQIPSAQRPGEPLDVKIPSSALRKAPPRPGSADMTSVARSKAFAFAMRDRDRITKGLTNFFSVLSIAIVPVGLWTPSLVVFYWFSSLVFTNVQTAYFLSVDKRALRAKQAAAAAAK